MRYKLDCGDSSCRFAEDIAGMRTNGGCRCFIGVTNSETVTRIKELLRVANAAENILLTEYTNNWYCDTLEPDDPAETIYKHLRYTMKLLKRLDRSIYE